MFRFYPIFIAFLFVFSIYGEQSHQKQGIYVTAPSPKGEGF